MPSPTNTLLTLLNHLLRFLLFLLNHHLLRRRTTTTLALPMPPPQQPRCHYEVLGLPQSCTADEIRSAYKRLALQRHPDKLVQSGLSAEAATASFQELVHAYEVLSDPKERTWYDSHRSKILFSEANSAGNQPSPDLFSFFSSNCYTDYSDSKKGFYKVYGEVFDRVYANEVNYVRKLGLGIGNVREAPAMGDLGSAEAQVNAFYAYWLGFGTVMDFCWVDQYDAGAGANRKSRRVMEEENRKSRRKAKREYNETVRGLAEFVKKRDKRVIDMMVRKERERERRAEEEKERKKALEREKMERARAYEEPEWARVKEEELEGLRDGEEVGGEGDEIEELYCVACKKKFKSEKQWKNHEQSKKHKEKVVELRESFADEDDKEEVEETWQGEEEDDGVAEHDKERDADYGGEDDDFASVDNSVDELEKKIGDRFVLEEVQGGGGDDDESDDAEEATGGLDDEASILEAMLSGRRNRRSVASHHLPKVSEMNGDAQSSSKETEFMEYNNQKTSKKSRRAKKGKGKTSDGDAKGARTTGYTEGNVPDKEHDGLDDPNASTSGVNDEVELNAQRSKKADKQVVERKGAIKRDEDVKPRNSSKGKKQKAKQKNSESTCEKCGEEFESRNRLHKHIAETGHASLKSR
ncbi:DNAJ protein JJJ1-like protein [Drosera capensis]